MQDDQLRSVLDLSLELGVDGWILTNTTLDRPEGITFPKEGGLSGQPLAPKAKSLLHDSITHLGDRKKDQLIISTGGVMTPEDAFERLRSGANLVQAYSALVFEGPTFFRQVAAKAN